MFLIAVIFVARTTYKDGNYDTLQLRISFYCK